MQHEVVLNIGPAGAVRCLYNEVLSLEDLGKVSIYRASLVEWNDDDRCWDVSMPDGTLIRGGFHSRSSAIAFEIDFWNHTL